MSVLSQVDLSLWYQRLGLPEGASAIVDRIRRSEPARRVGGGKLNVPGLYPSRKMGKTIQFESHRVEFAIALEMEEDTSVIEYYDQPCQIPLTYCNGSQRRISVMHTPDFFVLRTDSAGWEECKTDKDLVKLAQKSPHRYRQTRDGIWHSPPGEEYASALGLYYRVYPASWIDWVLVRNISYLDDYLRGEPVGFDSKDRELAIACISASPGISLDELIRRMATPAALDCVHSMIARREVYVDLRAASLTDPTSVRVFRDRESVTSGGAGSLRGRPVNIAVGSTIQWDGATWRVANVGESMIGLVGIDRNFTELPIGALERLIGEGRVVVHVADSDRRDTNRIHARLAAASERDLKIANHRFSALQAQRHGEREPNVSARTLRFWAARYREAAEAYGDGYIGLLPETQGRGNRRHRLPEKTRALMVQSIENDFETLKQKSKYACWVTLKHTCEQRGVAAPSYRAFRRAVRKRSQFEQTLKRKGRRLLDQLDVIKSIANRAGTPHVLVGTYDLLAFRNLSGQLSRRSVDVHFSRYRVDRPGEAVIFTNVLRSFAAQMPLAEPPDLAKEWEFLYERSIGCVGILKEWLVKALASTLGRGANRLERKDLDTCALSVSQCDKLLSECIEGEARLEESDDSRFRLRMRLGLNRSGASVAGQHRSCVPEPKVDTPRKPNRRPGQRRAKRDPIGIGKSVHAN